MDNGTLTKEEILAGDDLPVQLVSVPEWGGHVRIKALTAREFQEVGRQAQGNDEIFALHLVAASVVDEQGERLLSADDVQALGGRRWAAIRRLFQTALNLNGLSAEALELAAKNFETTLENDSGTSSPSSPGSSPSES